MPRPSKKAEEARAKAQQVVAPAPAAINPAVIPVQPVPLAVQPHPRQIDAEGFIRVRDSVHHRLLTILDLIKSFSADYYRQTSLLLGENGQDGVPGIDYPLSQLEHAMQGMPALAGLAPMGQEIVAPVEEGKKERKKRTHDPNAPKRPLTPYFLYMQTARPIIANDLGADAPKGAVQEEGQRRWKAMGQGEKNGWNNAYQYNLRLYQARVHSYKQAGNPDAKLMSDEDALAYAEEQNIPMPHVDGDATVAGDDDAIAEQLTAGAGDEDSAPSKTPKKGPTRKRKSEVAEPEPPKSAAAAAATPDPKKRRRTSKAADAETKEEASTKKGSRSKKAKN